MLVVSIENASWKDSVIRKSDPGSMIIQTAKVSVRVVSFIY